MNRIASSLEPGLAIIIVNWNGVADTIACVQSLVSSKSGAVTKIIVIDNGSTDESVKEFLEWCGNCAGISDGQESSAKLGYTLWSVITNSGAKNFQYEHRVQHSNTGACDIDLHVVETRKNGGYGFGCNVGMALARQLKCSAYWLLNNDCIVSANAASVVSARLKEDPFCLVGMVLRVYDRPTCIQAYAGGHFSSITGLVRTFTSRFEPTKLNVINGASLALSAEAALRIGEFDESLFMYFEENDYCIRAEREGLRFALVPVDVYHKHGAKRSSSSEQRAWVHVLKNKHTVLKKHYGIGLWLLIFWGTLICRGFLPGFGAEKRRASRQVMSSLLRGE